MVPVDGVDVGDAWTPNASGVLLLVDDQEDRKNASPASGLPGASGSWSITNWRLTLVNSLVLVSRESFWVLLLVGDGRLVPHGEWGVL
jgi:hypothetical protein